MNSVLNAIKRLSSSARIISVDDADSIQVVQVELLAGEVRNIKRLQNYGISTVPLAGAEGIAISLNGQRGRTIMINADDRRYRPINLEPGDSCLYTHEGTIVHLQKGRKVLIEAAASVIVKSADITFDGPVTCTNTLTVAGATTLQNTLAVIGNTTLAGNVVVAGTLGVVNAASFATSAMIADIDFLMHNHNYMDNATVRVTFQVNT